MTIHSGDPFVPPEQERSALRRLRGRLLSPVTLWTAGIADTRAGLTVTSALVVDGDPGHLLGVVDPESDLWARVHDSRLLAVSPLSLTQRHLADVFGGLAPAPGGPFLLADWVATDWGPVLAGAVTWCGCRVESAREVGYGLLVDATIEHVEIGTDPAPLGHYRGRYRGLDLQP